MNTETIRHHLKAAAKREPDRAPIFKGLSLHLRNYENGNASERAALKPMIQDSLKRIERGGYGR